MERIPAIEYQSPKIDKRSIISSDLQVYESTIPVSKNRIENIDVLETTFSEVLVDSHPGERMERLDIMEALVAERSKQLKNMIKKFDNTSSETGNKPMFRPKVTYRSVPPRAKTIAHDKVRKPYFTNSNHDRFQKSLPTSPNKHESSFLTRTFKFSPLKNVKLKLFKKNSSNDKMYVSALCRNAITMDVSDVSKLRETHILSENKTKNWLQTRLYNY